jgi:hypothetical protein
MRLDQVCLRNRACYENIVAWVEDQTLVNNDAGKAGENGDGLHPKRIHLHDAEIGRPIGVGPYDATMTTFDSLNRGQDPRR